MPCIGTTSHPAWDKLNNTGPPGPPGEQGESGPKGNQGPNGAPIPDLDPLGNYDVQIMKEVSLSDNTALGKISVPEAGVTVSYLIDVLKEMGIVSRDPKKWDLLGAQDLLVGVSEIYGYSVSLSADGKTMAVGGPNPLTSIGRVQVFRYKDETDKWDLFGAQALLVGDGADQFGYSVSLSADGKTVAVGAPLHDDKGRVQVFRYKDEDEEWNLLGAQTFLMGAAGKQQAGSSVSLSDDGKTVAVGVPNKVPNKGRVYVFSYNDVDEKWDLLGAQALLVGGWVDEPPSTSVSLSADGKTVAVGAPNYRDGESSKGRVQVFSYDDVDEKWNLLGAQALLVGVSSLYGWSVSLSADGKTVAVGAPNYSDDEGSDKGRVQVFSYDIISGWTQIGSDLVGAVVDQAGYSVSLSADGKTVAVGAPRHGDEGSDKGRVQVFSYDIVSGWTQIGGDLVGAVSNYTGSSVSLSEDGKTVAVAAPFYKDGEGSYKGRVQVFEL